LVLFPTFEGSKEKQGREINLGQKELPLLILRPIPI
jgi:hypothetical protein